MKFVISHIDNENETWHDLFTVEIVSDAYPSKAAIEADLEVLREALSKSAKKVNELPEIRRAATGDDENYVYAIAT